MTSQSISAATPQAAASLAGIDTGKAPSRKPE
jgi:hypothetical protein